MFNIYYTPLALDLQNDTKRWDEALQVRIDQAAKLASRTSTKGYRDGSKIKVYAFVYLRICWLYIGG